ncbi:MAG: tetratricopeptide repeat protein [Myxococcota bacterium]
MWLWMACFASAGAAEPDADAPAEDVAVSRARELYDQGRAHYLDGDHAAAIEAWRQSFALSGRVELLFNLSLAHERLGDLDAALGYLRRFREVAPEYRHDKIDRQIANLERRLAGNVVPAPAPEPPVVTPVVEEPLPATSRRPLEKARTALLVTGIAGLATSGVIALVARGARRDVDALCRQVEEGRVCPTEAAGALDTLAWARPAQVTSLVVGGAALGGSLGLFVAPTSRTPITLTLTVR